MRWPQNVLGAALDALEKHYSPQTPPSLNGPFEMILWEQVAYLASDETRAAAFHALRSRIGADPASILRAKKSALVQITALGGIHAELRAERIQQSAALSRDGLLDLPAPQAKKALMRFPMIGEPGAEKILLFCGKLNVLALESNGLRVLTRLGIAREAKSYSVTYRSAREATLKLLPLDATCLQQAHLLLRRHGMNLCFRTAPACHSCPLHTSCPSAER